MCFYTCIYFKRSATVWSIILLSDDETWIHSCAIVSVGSPPHPHHSFPSVRVFVARGLSLSLSLLVSVVPFISQDRSLHGLAQKFENQIFTAAMNVEDYNNRINKKLSKVQKVRGGGGRGDRVDFLSPLMLMLMLMPHPCLVGKRERERVIESCANSLRRGLKKSWCCSSRAAWVLVL